MALGLALAFLFLAGLELTSDPAVAADTAVLHWMLAHRDGALTSAARAVTNSGTSPLLYPLVALVGVGVRLRTGRWAPGVIALALVVAGVLSRLAVSGFVGDSRPPKVDWLMSVHGFSFPSGHATTSALVAGALVWLLTQLVRSRGARLIAVSGLVLWAVLVALSRLYLGVHWISDIAGSWLLAGMWLALLCTAVRPKPNRTGGGTREEWPAKSGGIG